MLLGDDAGPVLIPGDVEGSLFREAISWMDSDTEMPPDDPMPDEVIAHFKKWIEMGALDPRKLEKSEFHSTVLISKRAKSTGHSKKPKQNRRPIYLQQAEAPKGGVIPVRPPRE